MFSQLVVEFFFFEQLLKADMHAVAPVIFWNGRHIDAFIVGSRPAQGVAHAHQILHRKMLHMAGEMQVLVDDSPVYPGIAEKGRFTPLAQLFVEKPLGAHPVFFHQPRMVLISWVEE